MAAMHAQVSELTEQSATVLQQNRQLTELATLAQQSVRDKDSQIVQLSSMRDEFKQLPSTHSVEQGQAKMKRGKAKR